MKVMIKDNGKLKLNIVRHIIVKNFWEYYITDRKPQDNDDILEALVYGHEIELGDISLSELKPYIISNTVNLDIAPAPGFSWAK